MVQHIEKLNLQLNQEIILKKEKSKEQIKKKSNKDLNKSENSNNQMAGK